MQILTRIPRNVFHNMKRTLRVNRVHFTREDDEECKAEDTTHQEEADEGNQCQEKSETAHSMANFDILEANCHWIKPRQEGEADPSHGDRYFHHRLYHKYTYLDIMVHLTDSRQPQPTTSKKRIKN